MNGNRNYNHQYFLTKNNTLGTSCNHQCLCLKIIHRLHHGNLKHNHQCFCFSYLLQTLPWVIHLNRTYPAHSQLRTRHNFLNPIAYGLNQRWARDNFLTGQIFPCGFGVRIQPMPALTRVVRGDYLSDMNCPLPPAHCMLVVLHAMGRMSWDS